MHIFDEGTIAMKCYEIVFPIERFFSPNKV